MKRKWYKNLSSYFSTIVLLLILFTTIFLVSCSGGSETASPTVITGEVTEQSEDVEEVTGEVPAGQSEEGKQVLESILAEEKIDINSAYEKLSQFDFSGDEEALSLVQELSELINCQGQYLQTSEITGNSYTAIADFYLERGVIKCSVDYTGYMGIIQDGSLSRTKENGYLFESQTKGDLFGREQDFSIYFSPEKIRIMWASSDKVLDKDTKEYLEVNGEANYSNSIAIGKWTMQGLVKDDKTILFSAYPEIADLYDGYMLIINDNGSYSFYNGRHIDEGIWKEMTDDKLEHPILFQRQSVVTPKKTDDGITMDSVQSTLSISASISNVDKDTLIWLEGDQAYLFARDGGTSSLIGNYVQSEGNANSYDNDNFSDSSGATSGSSNYSSSIGSGERNALQKAHDYLDLMPFSYSGLISQLEYEGFSTSEATYAADNCGANWNEQAAKKAEQYLEIMSFSREGLFEQLIYEGFTESQAEYGVDKAY